MLKEAVNRLDNFTKGLEYFHSYQPEARYTHADFIWREGSTRLLDYGGAKGDTPVLFVPSLINRAYVLDLTEKRSLIRHLRNKQLHCYLLDWDTPTEAEAEFRLEDYITQRLLPAAREVKRRTGKKPALVGYCMGGLMSLAASLLEPDLFSGLGLLATPWDFHSADVDAFGREAGMLQALEGAITQMNGFPRNALYSVFYALNPFAVHEKLIYFSSLDKTSPEAKELMEMETWLNDGVPLVREVARECFVQWPRDNTLQHQSWSVAGRRIRPGELKIPALVALPQHDRIVPPACALALAQSLPAATLVSCPSGHIGMVVGRTAPQHLWLQLEKWLRTL